MIVFGPGKGTRYLLGCWVLAGFIGCGPGPESAKPNILFVIIDTLRADHLGCYGYPRNTTPNLDRLAREAELFTAAYSHSPWTVPSVASMFTARVPRDLGITDWAHSLHSCHLTLAEHLAAQGYRTMAYGGHVILKAKFNLTQGFDEVDCSVLDKGHHHEINSSREVSELGLAALREPSARPFFIWLHYFDPHAKYNHHPRFGYGKRPADRYDSEIAFTDQQLGRVIRALRRQGLWDRTIVVVVGDHGEEFLDHGGTSHTTTLYDELLRIPLILRVPGHRPGLVGHTVAESELAPSLLALAGLPVPDGFPGGVWAGRASALFPAAGRPIFCETLRYADKRGVVLDDWKLIHDREAGRFQLFNLAADPGERVDRSAARPRIFETLKALLESHYRVARAEATAGPLSPELRESLRGLGYLDE